VTDLSRSHGGVEQRLDATVRSSSAGSGGCAGGTPHTGGRVEVWAPRGPCGLHGIWAYGRRDHTKSASVQTSCKHARESPCLWLPERPKRPTCYQTVTACCHSLPRC